MLNSMRTNALRAGVSSTPGSGLSSREKIESTSVLSEKSVENALHWLIDNADKAAKARAERQYVEDYAKVIKSMIMKENANLPLGAQEREAYADPRYVKHLDAIREAVHMDEYMRFVRDAESAKIEAWRTQCSNERAKL